jgi:hypothetical protein
MHKLPSGHLQFASFDDRSGWILKSFEVLMFKLFVIELKWREVKTKMTKGKVYEVMSV